jgi:homogentisate 1,2-dioxygenase
MELAPQRQTNTMAFMFETRYPQRVSKYAAGLETLQQNYMNCWKNVQKHFDPTRR